MLAELDIAIFLKIEGDLPKVAGRVFHALGVEGRSTMSDDLGEHYVAGGLGFRALLFPNEGDLQDPEFERYTYTLEIISNFWCADIDAIDLEGPLSEYYARLLAFDLGVETATAVQLEITEEREVFEVQAFQRNPNYRLDQPPTVAKVFVIETRQIEDVFAGDEM